MKHSRLFFFVMTTILALFFSACSGRPTDSIQRTEQAKAEAAAEHADLFAPDYWSAAEKAMLEANAKLDAKSYGEAGNLLLRARTNYNKARELAKSKREQLIKNVNGMLVTIGMRLKTDLVDDPAAGRLPAARKKELDDRVKQIENGAATVSDHLKNGRYTEAEILAGRTMREIFVVQQEFLKK
jgi:alkanesulfonate monooxygenase SsuD/methylene tetrahydromethanopterin reductase-like flavin-dependent oxidoreductase (luciferase family)